jgi:hypothetical protein
MELGVTTHEAVELMKAKGIEYEVVACGNFES